MLLACGGVDDVPESDGPTLVAVSVEEDPSDVVEGAEEGEGDVSVMRLVGTDSVPVVRVPLSAALLVELAETASAEERADSVVPSLDECLLADGELSTVIDDLSEDSTDDDLLDLMEPLTKDFEVVSAPAVVGRT